MARWVLARANATWGSCVLLDEIPHQGSGLLSYWKSRAVGNEGALGRGVWSVGLFDMDVSRSIGLPVTKEIILS